MWLIFFYVDGKVGNDDVLLFLKIFLGYEEGLWQNMEIINASQILTNNCQIGSFLVIYNYYCNIAYKKRSYKKQPL